MFSVLLTSENYFSGSYYDGMSVPGTIQVNVLPGYIDEFKQRSCKLVSGEWVYDPEKYAELTQPSNDKTLEEEIDELKELYAELLMEIA